MISGLTGNQESSSAEIDMVKNNIVISGKYVKIAEIKDEWYDEVTDPISALDQLKIKKSGAHIFTFIQKPPETVPKYNYHMEWDNVAAIPTDSFEKWWKSRIPKQTRTNIRRSEKKGVKIIVAEYNDEFVKGIQAIYNESPLRQGKPFWHYHKSFDALKVMHASYLERSNFIGAYLEGELIGFIKLVFSGKTARTMHIISMLKHRDKSPNNAMLAKAIEICCEKGIDYLIYGKLDYGKVGSLSLKIFKEENGFEKVNLPRYYIPLNITGKIFLKLGLHHDVVSLLPEWVIRKLIEIRNGYYLKKLNSSKP